MIFTHRQVYGVHRGGIQCSGEAVIYRGSLAVYPDKVFKGYIARHNIGLPALGAVGVGGVLHLYPVLRATGDGCAFIVRAGGVTIDFHTLRQCGLRAAEYHTHLGKLVLEAKGNFIVVGGIRHFGFRHVCKTFGLVAEVNRLIRWVPGGDSGGGGACPVELSVCYQVFVGTQRIGSGFIAQSHAYHFRAIPFPHAALAVGIILRNTGLRSLCAPRFRTAFHIEGDAAYLQGIFAVRQFVALSARFILRTGSKQQEGCRRDYGD